MVGENVIFNNWTSWRIAVRDGPGSWKGDLEDASWDSEGGVLSHNISLHVGALLELTA